MFCKRPEGKDVFCLHNPNSQKRKVLKALKVAFLDNTQPEQRGEKTVVEEAQLTLFDISTHPFQVFVLVKYLIVLWFAAVRLILISNSNFASLSASF